MDNLRHLLLPFFSFSMHVQGRKGNRFYQESSDMNTKITSLFGLVGLPVGVVLVITLFKIGAIMYSYFVQLDSLTKVRGN